MKFGFEHSNAQDLVSWEELNNNGYYCVPPADNWGKDPPGMIEFYKDPDSHPLKTWTGKIEFEARDLLEHFPNDEERPPIPHWIPFGKTHQESREHPRAKKYPLLIVSNHGRWREHAQLDDVAWFREIQTCKVHGWDGYKYEPVWIHPSEAAKRGIRTGDIVKVYNERGAVLGGAYVTERVRPGVAYMDHGSRVDPIIPGKLDRGGAINLITPAKTISPNTQGQVGSAFLVEAEKVTEAQMEEWKRQYPEAFNRAYEPAYGLRFNAWVEESDG
jgi:trimethylamine-N-oxide reductase (cytochrome c)